MDWYKSLEMFEIFNYIRFLENRNMSQENEFVEIESQSTNMSETTNEFEAMNTSQTTNGSEIQPSSLEKSTNTSIVNESGSEYVCITDSEEPSKRRHDVAHAQRQPRRPHFCLIL